jgi:hypothetical protein
MATLIIRKQWKYLSVALMLLLLLTISKVAEGGTSEPPPDVEKDVTVPEMSISSDTGINLNFGDRIVINAGGDIWAGVQGTERNGPEGWNEAAPSGYPLPDANKYSLILKIGGVHSYVGSGTEFDYCSIEGQQ